MSDDGCGWVGFTAVVALIVVGTVAMSSERRERAEGYRRGFCEGRGGVEATVGDSIRCIRPPTPVGTTMGAGVQGGGDGERRAGPATRAARFRDQGEADPASAKTPAPLTFNAEA